MKLYIVLFLTLVCNSLCLGTIWPNSPFKIVTKDSIVIVSTPYCSLGNFGKTIVSDKRNGKLLYTLNFYVNSECIFTRDGNYWVDPQSNLDFYYRDSLIKYYDQNDFSGNLPQDVSSGCVSCPSTLGR